MTTAALPKAPALTPVVRWLDREEIADLYTAGYWNDLGEERKKEWWIVDGDYGRCSRYLQSSRLLGQYRFAERFVSSERLRVADLAAGIGWTSALLSRLPCVSEVLAVEMSEHRLEIFEHAVLMFGGNPAKISRFLGSFYDLRFEDQSIDLVFMSQAFHHADQPFLLLQECDRVVRRGGRIILIGEHYIGPKRIVRRFLSSIVKDRKWTTNFFELFAPAPIGDHYYRVSDYYLMFRTFGYRLRHYPVGPDVIYVADKP